MEDYKKKYMQALERAKVVNPGTTDYNIVTEIFPELRESGDEKIRKELIKLMKQMSNTIVENYTTIEISTFVAWLEKQGENELQKYINDERNKKGFYHCGNEVSWNEMPLDVRKHDYPYYFKGNLDCYPFNVETQDEQTDYNQYKVTMESIAAMVEKYANDGDLKDFYDNVAVKCHDAMEYEKMWRKQGEKKPADKIEPKFKVGDWVVWDNKISCHIDNIYQGKESLMYTITDVHNITRSYSVKCFDNNAYLWTIQDAQIGDVLVASDGSIFLSAGLVDCACNFYVALTINKDIKINKAIGGSCWETSKAVHPATQEQRDLLFSKMKEAGYAWNAEKKELKKIDKNPADKSDVLMSLDEAIAHCNERRIK